MSEIQDATFSEVAAYLNVMASAVQEATGGLVHSQARRALNIIIMHTIGMSSEILGRAVIAGDQLVH